jgi:hypothetical protein
MAFTTEANLAADDGRIAAEPTLPQAIAEDDDARPAGPILGRGEKPTMQRGLDIF